MDCPSCDKAMRLIQTVNVGGYFVDTEPDENGEISEKIKIGSQRNQTLWECASCKMSEPVD